MLHVLALYLVGKFTSTPGLVIEVIIGVDAGIASVCLTKITF